MGLSGAKNSPLKPIVDVASSSVTYIGWAAPGAVTSAAAWRILKITESGGTTSFLWPSTGVDFKHVWDNRASLTYV